MQTGVLWIIALCVVWQVVTDIFEGPVFLKTEIAASSEMLVIIYKTACCYTLEHDSSNYGMPTNTGMPTIVYSPWP